MGEERAVLGRLLDDVGVEAFGIQGEHHHVVEIAIEAIERALVLSGGAPIEPGHLPDRLLERISVGTGDAPAIDVRQRVADVERTSVLDALESTKGNQTKAAKKLGISRFALIRLMEKHDLKKR